MKKLFLALLALSSGSLLAQSISPQVIGSAGGSGTASGVTVDWTVGEVAVTRISNGTNTVTQGFHQGDEVKISANIIALLQGPFDSGTGLMGDGLRANGYIPATEPYTALGLTHVGGGGETVAPTVLAVTGNDAIVDWVFIDLRDKNDNTVVLATRSALVQRDGDIVDVDGVSSVTFEADADDYYVSVQHRNHLSVISASTISLSSTAASINFVDGSTPTFGTDAQFVDGGSRMLWAGDVTDDGQVKYTGGNNDRDPILAAIGGSVPTASANGYLLEDVNMNGQVLYTGGGNDRDPILAIIGGSVPTAVRMEQMP